MVKVIYHDFINCVNNFDNTHTFVTSKYLLQEDTGKLYLPVSVDTCVFEGSFFLQREYFSDPGTELYM